LSMMKVSFYYIYNFINYILLISLYSDYREKVVRVIYIAVILSIFFQVIMLFMGGGFTGTRMVGSFNNPNQLGYYALLTTSILMVLSKKHNVKGLWFFLAVGFNLLLIVASLSSTAIISYILLIFLFIKSRIENKRFKINIILYFIIGIITFLLLYKTTNKFSDSMMVKGLQNRVLTVEQKTAGVIQQRGYNRITEY